MTVACSVFLPLICAVILIIIDKLPRIFTVVIIQVDVINRSNCCAEASASTDVFNAKSSSQGHVRRLMEVTLSKSKEGKF